MGRGGRSLRIADRQQTRPSTPTTTPAEPAAPTQTPAPSLAVPSPLGAGPSTPLTPPSPLHPATVGAPPTQTGTSYAVVFDTDGGAPKPPDQQVTENQRARRPADPVKAGHVFDGWFTGNTPVAYDFNRPVTGRVELKAHWSPASNDTWSMTPNHGPTTGSTEVTLTPPAPRGIHFTQVSAGAVHAIGIGSDGNLYTWGNNVFGQLGRTTNNSTSNPTPGLVPFPGPAIPTSVRSRTTPRRPDAFPPEIIPNPGGTAHHKSIHTKSHTQS